jgi:hypothetical protein
MATVARGVKGREDGFELVSAVEYDLATGIADSEGTRAVGLNAVHVAIAVQIAIDR